MTHNILRSSSRKACSTAGTKHLLGSRLFSSKASGWFTRFLSPSEEKKLYFGITSSFREKLVEQSNKSAQTYSNIIEHAIFSGKPLPFRATKLGMLSLARIEQLKIDLDSAGQQKDVQRLHELELEMNRSDLKTVTIYNRLIRAYLWSDALNSAQQVLDAMESNGMIPTTRTYTYLIQAYLKQTQLQQAKQLVEQMQKLSLLKLRNQFDYGIMLKYYRAVGDTHAIECVWREMMLHADTLKPGPGLFTQYLEYLFCKKDMGAISQLSQDFMAQQLRTHHQAVLNPHQFITWLKAVKLLANTSKKHDTQQAEHLLFFVMRMTPPKTLWNKTKTAIQRIVTSYLTQEQELKALAFYYKLGKMGVPNEVFDPEMLKSIDAVLQNVNEENKAVIMAELEGLIVAKV
ncbi:hypothetical protein [Parasitella parasitica]|uniref:Pentacotripeptide-repeat region of PRORP domain-containing protein n=1 Tax=Parasitella parasitica TaxID=35722 RepID=A0A0B7MUP7_9FUNG|nr:hypothetical protein [Parasitella parasitica]